MLRPVTPAAPTKLNSQPPTIAPTIPSRISTTVPSPVLLTSLLARKPAASPSTIQAKIDMPLPLVDDLAGGILEPADGILNLALGFLRPSLGFRLVIAEQL